MNYNDFPILSNEEYQIINKHFSQTENYNRKTILHKICSTLNNCQFMCLGLQNKHNNKINNQIKKTHKTIIKLIDNLSSSFNINIPETNRLKSGSIFTFLKEINFLISLTTLWAKNEEKEYYKRIAYNTIDDLITINDDILSTLNESNIHFFKHM